MAKEKYSIAEQLRPFYLYIRKYRNFYTIGVIALIVVDVLEVFPPLFLKQGVDTLGAGSATTHSLAMLAALYVGVALLQACMRYLWRMYIVRTSLMAADDMRRGFFSHLSQLAPAFFKRRRVGDLVSLQSNDIQNVRFVLGPAVLVFCDAVFYLLSIVPVMIWLSPKLALISLIPLLFVTPYVMKLDRVIQKHFMDVQDRFSDLASESQESLGGVRVIKGAGLETLKEKIFERLGKLYVDANIRSALSQSALNVGLNFFVSAAITILFVIGGSLVIGEKVSIGTFVAFHLYIQKMTWPMEALGLTVTYIQRGVASQKRLDEVLAEENQIQNCAAQTRLAPSKIPHIEVRNLNFRYPNSNRPALENINFTLEPGMRLGIAGAIGSGKTTLLHCLARLEPVERGMIFFDGVDVNDIPLDEVRQRIAMVPQDSFLFSESIADNILYGSEMFDDKSPARATYAGDMAKLAHLYEEIQVFPEKFSTRLGERGLNISGGQKQRVTIARALAQNPNVLIFDDCLSAVDSITENHLTNSFHQYSRNRSFIFCSHRVSSLLRMDEILVLQDGRIAESGPVEELLNQKKYFYQLASQQRMAEFLGMERQGNV